MKKTDTDGPYRTNNPPKIKKVKIKMSLFQKKLALAFVGLFILGGSLTVAASWQVGFSVSGIFAFVVMCVAAMFYEGHSN